LVYAWDFFALCWAASAPATAAEVRPEQVATEEHSKVVVVPLLALRTAWLTLEPMAAFGHHPVVHPVVQLVVQKWAALAPEQVRHLLL